MDATGPNTASMRTRSAFLVLVPAFAVILSNLDAALLLFVEPESALGRYRVGMWATIPLSFIAGLWTYGALRRLARQIQIRISAEQSLRVAAQEREIALRDLRASLSREVSLRKELDHRVRNNLAGLVGLVGLYEESGKSASELADAVRGKIAALREVYRLINSTGSEHVEFRGLVESVVAGLAPSDSLSRVSMSGPAVMLSSAQASAFAMIFQELLTNSGKHGALRRESADVGRVALDWSVDASSPGSTLTVDWSEHTGPRAAKSSPDRECGVGLPLIVGLAATDLRGGAEFSHTPEDWRVRLRAGLSIPSSLAPEPRHDS